MYKIGDKVLYPMHGAGVIEGIEEQKLLKEKQQYYIMRMPAGNMKVMIPVNKTVEIGIRDIIGKEEALEAVRQFKEIKPYFNDNWNKRYRENMLKIKTGNILDTMEVLKSLMIREKERGLSTAERKMLNNSKNIFISEIVLSQAMLKEEIESYLDEVITEELKK